MDFNLVLKRFGIKGDFRGYRTYTNGNINSTFELTVFDKEIKIFILQKINKYVFKNPEQVMENIVRVTDYMRENYKGEESVDRMVLKFYKDIETNKPYFIDENEEYWRCYEFIDNSVTYDICFNEELIFESGKAFGKFQKMLNDFDANTLYETIPNFHNTVKRYTDLFHAIIDDEKSRVRSVKNELTYLIDNRAEAENLCSMLNNNEIPLRVTHNDTKCNNVLFDIDSGKSLAVIDLDTVMPGVMAYDFGDAVRSVCSLTGEDERDLSKVCFDLNRFEAFSKGFLSELKNNLSVGEIKSLSLAPYAITCELASRFLEDYLRGDKYFKINYPEHNLDRAKCQIALAKDIKKKEVEILETIKRNIC